MTASVHHVHYTLEEYVSLEELSTVKHEYLGGQIYAMAGGTAEHAALVHALSLLIGRQLLGGRCRGFSSDLRVRVEATGLDTYPDFTVVCGPRAHDAHDRLALNNPTLLAEVLSPSTEEYDRAEKFEHYRQLPSLRHYVLVDPRRRTMEVRTRAPDQSWATEVCGEGEVVELAAVGARVDVGELFETAAEPQ